jgi:hypothetical protein
MNDLLVFNSLIEVIFADNTIQNEFSPQENKWKNHEFERFAELIAHRIKFSVNLTSEEKDELKEEISTTTLKRMLQGEYIKEDELVLEPRKLRSLNKIAIFVGSKGWHSFKEKVRHEKNTQKPVIQPVNVSPNKICELTPVVIKIENTYIEIRISKEIFQKNEGFHFLLVAEDGFSILNNYRQSYNVNSQVIKDFVATINAKDEGGSLFPRVPISVIPNKFFRKYKDSRDAKILNQFQNHIKEFLKANREMMHIQNLVIDFHISDENVPEQYIDRLIEELRFNPDTNSFSKIIVCK